MHINNKLDGLINKAGKLTVENKQLKARNAELLAEIEHLKTLLQQQERNAEELNNKIKIIKLAQNLGSETPANFEITELKRKLNEYIKEIDSCMAMLNE